MESRDAPAQTNKPLERASLLTGPIARMRTGWAAARRACGITVLSPTERSSARLHKCCSTDSPPAAGWRHGATQRQLRDAAKEEPCEGG